MGRAGGPVALATAAGKAQTGSWPSACGVDVPTRLRHSVGAGFSYKAGSLSAGCRVRPAFFNHHAFGFIAVREVSRMWRDRLGRRVVLVLVPITRLLVGKRSIARRNSPPQADQHRADHRGRMCELPMTNSVRREPLFPQRQRSWTNGRRSCQRRSARCGRHPSRAGTTAPYVHAVAGAGDREGASAGRHSRSRRGRQRPRVRGPSAAQVTGPGATLGPTPAGLWKNQRVTLHSPAGNATALGTTLMGVVKPPSATGTCRTIGYSSATSASSRAPPEHCPPRTGRHCTSRRPARLLVERGWQPDGIETNLMARGLNILGLRL